MDSVAVPAVLAAFRLIDGLAGEMNGAPAKHHYDDADDVAMNLVEALGIPFDENWPEAAAHRLASAAADAGGDWVMVPRVPTEAMLKAGADYFWQSGADVAQGYKVLLTAAPAPAADVERLARAIAEPIFRQFDGWRHDDPFDFDTSIHAKDREIVRSIARAALAPRDPAPEQFAESAKNPGDAEGEHRFALGDRVEKKKGSAWHGVVVGFYSTRLTPIGYAVESEREPGSVQIYPDAALQPAAPEQPAGEGVRAELVECLRGMLEVFVSDCGVPPCEGSMAPAEDLCGRAQRLLAALQPAAPAGRGASS